MSGDPTYDTSGRTPIHVVLPNGQQAVYAEIEVHEMLTRRALSRHNYFWKEGMTEWLPMTELPPLAGFAIVPPRRAVAAPPPIEIPYSSYRPDPTPPEPRVDWRGTVPELPAQNFRAPIVQPGGPPRQYYLQNNPAPLTFSMQILILVSIWAISFFILECYAKMEGWTGLFDSSLTPIVCFFGALVGIHLVIDVLFFYWLFRAHRNCRGFVSNVRFTSDAAVSSFFVPGLNFVRPYQVVQEVWKVSERPWSWIGARDSILVGCWFFLRTSVFVLAVVRFHTIYAGSESFSVSADGFVSYAATLGANLLLIELTTYILITVVTARQLKYAAEN